MTRTPSGNGLGISAFKQAAYSYSQTIQHAKNNRSKLAETENKILARGDSFSEISKNSELFKLQTKISKIERASDF